MKNLLWMLVFAAPIAGADCAETPEFTTTIAVSRVLPVSAGGCWLVGHWKDAKGGSQNRPLFTTEAAWCGKAYKAVRKVRAVHACCDAGGMPPPCSWGTEPDLSSRPSGVQVWPAK